MSKATRLLFRPIKQIKPGDPLTLKLGSRFGGNANKVFYFVEQIRDNDDFGYPIWKVSIDRIGGTTTTYSATHFFHTSEFEEIE